MKKIYTITLLILVAAISYGQTPQTLTEAGVGGSSSGGIDPATLVDITNPVKALTQDSAGTIGLSDIVEADFGAAQWFTDDTVNTTTTAWTPFHWEFANPNNSAIYTLAQDSLVILENTGVYSGNVRANFRKTATGVRTVLMRGQINGNQANCLQYKSTTSSAVGDFDPAEGSFIFFATAGDTLKFSYKVSNVDVDLYPPTEADFNNPNTFVVNIFKVTLE